MTTLTHSATNHTDATHSYTPQPNWLAAYHEFTEQADYNRIGWAATAIAIQGCLLAPALLFTMNFFGGGDWQFLVAIVSFMLVLISVLAAMPVKYIFSAFAISFVIHVVIILINIL